MGKVYENPERPGYIFVHDADPKLERPPASGEGEIVEVDMAHRDVLARGSWIRCQACGTSVERSRPHPCAYVSLEADTGFSVYKSAHFCNAECWAAWAGRRG